MFGKGLEGIEESKLKDGGGETKRGWRNRWWEEYEVLRRKLELDNEGGLVGEK